MSRIDQINEQIVKLVDERNRIQDACSHPPLAREYMYGSNTGNYDPHADCYWVEYHCTLCHKRWTVDSDQDDYRVPEEARQVHHWNQ